MTQDVSVAFSVCFKLTSDQYYNAIIVHNLKHVVGRNSGWNLVHSFIINYIA